MTGRFGIHSVRARLMLWNIGILSLTLALLGVLISYTVRAKMIEEVRRQLLAHSFDLPGPPRHRDAIDRPDGENEPAQGGPPERRLANGGLNRPRVFDRDGHGRPPFEKEPPWDLAALQSALAGETISTEVTIEGEPFLLVSRPDYQPPRGRYRDRDHPDAPPDHGGEDQPPPLPPGARFGGVVQAIYPLTDIYLGIGEVNRTLLTLIPVALICAGLGGAWLTERAMRPVRQITQTAARIGAADLSRRLAETGGDEFAELAGTINGMLGRLESAFNLQQALIQQQRRFTADASHELKTPLTVIKANSSLTLAIASTSEQYHEAMVEIDRSANRMNKLVQDLLLLARADEGQLSRHRGAVELNGLLLAAADGVRRVGCAAINVVTLPEERCVHGDADELSRVFTNLLENAVRYTPADGHVTVRIISTGAAVRVAVSDTGPGIAAEHLPHLCERFYRIDSARARSDGGSGLGLAICKSITEAHGGSLRIESVVGQGATVTVELPLSGAN